MPHPDRQMPPEVEKLRPVMLKSSSKAWPKPKWSSKWLCHLPNLPRDSLSRYCVRIDSFLLKLMLKGQQFNNNNLALINSPSSKRYSSYQILAHFSVLNSPFYLVFFSTRNFLALRPIQWSYRKFSKWKESGKLIRFNFWLQSIFQSTVSQRRVVILFLVSN